MVALVVERRLVLHLVVVLHRVVVFHRAVDVVRAGVLHLAVDVVPLRHSALLPDQRRTNPTQGPSVSYDVWHSTRRGIFQTSLTRPTVFHSLSMHTPSRLRNQTSLKIFEMP